MLVVDDLLIKPLVSLLDILHTMALNELYDVEALQEDLKENQLLYEIGERPEPEYRERKQALEAELSAARELRERLEGKVEVKG